MKTRKVLTIDHVFKIVGAVADGTGWAEAIMAVLPVRKGAKEKKVGEDEAVKEDEKENGEKDVEDSEVVKEEEEKEESEKVDEEIKDESGATS